MKIRLVELSNFRKLKAVRLDLTDKTTVLVGANNSGKTTAMDALRHFLTGQKFQLSDFTLSDLAAVRSIGERWEAGGPLDSDSWAAVLPSLDVWIESSEDELHRTTQLIPLLDGFVGIVGVRLRLEARDLENLRASYVAKRAAIVATIAASDPEKLEGVKLWPVDFLDFLQRELPQSFHVASYTLDASQLSPAVVVGGEMVGSPSSDANIDSTLIQPLVEGQLPLESNPLRELIRVDVVDAQRGVGGAESSSRLSDQVSSYYDAHLDPLKAPTVADLDAIRASQQASAEFDTNLEFAFKEALEEIAGMGYPGSLNPRVVIRTSLSFRDGLKHSSVLKYRLDDGAEPGSELLLELPENLNGLGYQNLVLMIFNLLGFRAARLKSGKAKVSDPLNKEPISPIHLVLVEEPEAHLHAQVQQVFIRRAYDTLRPKSMTVQFPNLTTQLVVSTHSPHVAHEIDFACIRYFRHKSASGIGSVPTSTIRDLSEIFGAADATAKFVARYIRADHCNLFFADAAILLEGAAERILVPHFIRTNYSAVHESYVEVLEIGGAHAHRLRSLIDVLGIPVLVITDIDVKNGDTGKKERPVFGSSQVSGNDTIKSWLSGPNDLDSVSKLAGASKEVISPRGGHVRFAFQTEIDVLRSGTSIGRAIPSTFEDAIGLENLDVFAATTAAGLPAKFRSAITSESTSDGIAAAMYNAVEKADKAKFALDLIWLEEVESLVAPSYISEGLAWLSEQVSLLPVMRAKVSIPSEPASDAEAEPDEAGARQ